jgi:23S rRNA pseudouridine2605 synthase
MAKRNSSSDSTGSRRGSSRTGSGKSSPGKRSSSAPSDKRKKDFDTDARSRTSSGKSKAGGRSLSKSDREDSDKPRFKKSSDKPFDRDKKSDAKKSFGRPERGTSATREDKSFGKPSKGTSRSSFNKDEDKPERRGRAYGASERSEGSNRASSSDRTERPERRGGKSFGASSERPYKKFDKSADSGKDDSSSEKGSLRPYRKSFTRTSEGEAQFQPAREAKSFSSRKEKAPVNKAALDEARISDPDKIRLNRYIANSGLCSRREADEYITMGLVTVNGKVITELGFKVNRDDEVRYEEKVLRAEKLVYILMNKPKGYLTTTKDPQERNTVMQILGPAVKERVYPVGRLDRNTTGLLLLTNDGELADKLMHPSYNVKKIYKVELDRPITKSDFKKIQEGVRLEEGRASVDDLAIISDDNKTVGIEIHIGWNRVVRRIFESLLYQVVKLDRSFYAGLDKKELPRGHWRFLKKEEVVLLKHYK